MSSSAVPVLLLAGGLTDVDLTLTASTLVLFALFAFVLGRFGWKPLLHTIEERERSVREEVEGARVANAEAQALLAKHKEMVREAGREREELLQKTIEEAGSLRADLVAKSRAESEQILARAREQIQRDKDVAVQQLRAEVAELALQAAEKVVRSSLTPATQRQLVDEFIAGLPRAD